MGRFYICFLILLKAEWLARRDLHIILEYNANSGSYSERRFIQILKELIIVMASLEKACIAFESEMRNGWEAQ